MFFRTIKFRLTAWYLLVLAVLLALFGLLSYFMLSYNLYQNLDNSLRNRAQEIGRTLIVDELSGRISLRHQIGEMVLLYDPAGELLLSTGTELDEATLLELLNDAQTGNNEIVVAKTTDEQTVYLLATTVRRMRFNVILILGRAVEDTVQALNEFRQILFATAGITIILAGAGGWFLAARALKPVDEITRTARGISETDLSRRVKVRTKDELGRLAETLNAMIDRLERAFARQRQFTADASHELRTPLAVIEAEATLALRNSRSPEEYEKSLESINQEVNYMSTILEKLLMLARADAGKEQLNFAPVDLKELVNGLVPDIETLAQEKGLTFTTGEVADLTVKGDEIKLRQLLLNLLDNAIKYTPAGTVTLSLTRNGNDALLTVSDTGAGIPEPDLPHIFERFYRVDKARSRSEHGTGLGLAIVKYIVEAHGGSIAVESQVGKGTTFNVRLPVSV